ncbi:hypothetical protein XENORESO_018267 [Xenotaenia resolanae]|uniref:Uncharacterized protein n=1 Tax=Xenotaenia resolanae TaxID=208358 RepID=A0ABV0VRH5_9TELE
MLTRVPKPMNPSMNFHIGPPPNRDTDIEQMPPNPNTIIPLPTGVHPHRGAPSRKADEDTPTQCKLHTQLRSKNPHHILLSTTQRTARPRQGPRATLPQPLPTGQTPPSTMPPTVSPTPHQEETNSPSKRSLASGKHLGPDPLQTTQTHHITPTATITQGETLTSSAPPSPLSRFNCR